MNRDLSLSKEKFSFIHTITIYPHQNNDKLHQHSSVNEINDIDVERVSVEKTAQKIQKVSSSSALCTRDNTASNSSLNFNSLGNIPSTISDYWYSFNTSNSDNSTLSSIIYVPETKPIISPKKFGFNHYLDKILLIFATGYLCLVFWWLFTSKNALLPLAFLSPQDNISQADAEFIDYMKQSLEVIDRQVVAKQSSAKTAASNKTSEIVYVPVYTPTPTANSNNPNNLPPLLSPPPPPNNLTALKPPISTIKIQPPIPPSEAVKVKTTPTESSLKNAETSVTESISESNTPREIAAATITPNIEHTLVGLMELKEGSAALFKIAGVTQRIWLGEEIENTGWVLDSVANQKAKISYQGKILTLSVGETFKDKK